MNELALATGSITRRHDFDIPGWLRMSLAGAGATMTLLSLYAVGRWLLGYSGVSIKSFAVAFHIVTVVPAIPLGAYLLFARKGGVRHKMLGRLWLGLMGTTAFSTLFIREVNDGQFSWLHLLTVLTFVGVPQVIRSARQGNYRQHRNHLIRFYTGALILAGITAFAPGRTMWHWAFG